MTGFLAVIGQLQPHQDSQGSQIIWRSRPKNMTKADSGLTKSERQFQDRIEPLADGYGAVVGSGLEPSLANSRGFRALRIGCVPTTIGTIAYIGCYGFATTRFSGRGPIPVGAVFGASLEQDGDGIIDTAVAEIERVFDKYQKLAIDGAGIIFRSATEIMKDFEWDVKSDIFFKNAKVIEGRITDLAPIDISGSAFIARTAEDHGDVEEICSKLFKAMRPGVDFDCYIAQSISLDRQMHAKAGAKLIRYLKVDEYLKELTPDVSEIAPGQVPVERSMTRGRGDKPVAQAPAFPTQSKSIPQEPDLLRSMGSSLEQISISLSKIAELAGNKPSAAPLPDWRGLRRWLFSWNSLGLLGITALMAVILTWPMWPSRLVGLNSVPPLQTTNIDGELTRLRELQRVCLSEPTAFATSSTGSPAWNEIVARSQNSGRQTIDKLAISDVDEFMAAAKDSFRQKFTECMSGG